MQPGSEGHGLLPAPEEVIAGRSGHVLIKHTVLKADHFPSEHGHKLHALLAGVVLAQGIPGSCCAAHPTLARLHGSPCPPVSALAARAGCHNTKLTPILEGAPNFRKVRLGEVLRSVVLWHAKPFDSWVPCLLLHAAD